MSIHDWSRVDAGIFHHFHQAWIGQIARVLNDGLLPGDYYALAEQFVAGLGPDVLTLQGAGNDNDNGSSAPGSSPTAGVKLAAPKLQPVAETDMAFYRRKQNVVTVRHVSDDRVVAILEIVSPGKDKPLTLAAYECGNRVRAYVVHAAIGEPIAEMPLFLEPGLAVSVPLDATYQAAFAEVPRRWQRVLAAT